MWQLRPKHHAMHHVLVDALHERTEFASGNDFPFLGFGVSHKFNKHNVFDIGLWPLGYSPRAYHCFRDESATQYVKRIARASQRDTLEEGLMEKWYLRQGLQTHCKHGNALA